MFKITTSKSVLYPLALFVLTTPLASFTASFTAKVVRVIDGDTVQVYDGVNRTKIRLYGIDSPESKQAFGQQAKRAMLQLAANQNVVIEDHGKDVYGRTLGTIYLDNQDINAVMVSEGMAWAYRYQGRFTVPQYGSLEQNARDAKKGLWADPHAVEPRLWRKAND